EQRDHVEQVAGVFPPARLAQLEGTETEIAETRQELPQRATRHAVGQIGRQARLPLAQTLDRLWITAKHLREPREGVGHGGGIEIASTGHERQAEVAIDLVDAPAHERAKREMVGERRDDRAHPELDRTLEERLRGG